MKSLSSRRPDSAHALSAQGLHETSQLMVFNWLVAAYAHRDWLGSWANLLEPRADVEMRLLRRASLALLDRYGLRQRWLRRADEHTWLLLPPKQLEPAAQELGVAMLGGWVRNGLTREQVAQQLRVLGADQRATAMNYAVSLRALPYSTSGSGWPMASLDPSSVFQLGASCMAALLTDETHGARERFLMRFPRGLLVHIELNEAQRSEARNLILEQTSGARSVFGATQAQGVKR